MSIKAFDRILRDSNNNIVYSLYIHIFPNNKVYIGITKYLPKYRWGKEGKGYEGQIVWKAIKKYGWDNIKHRILLETTDKEFVEKEERRYITEVYHSNDDKFGYNIDNGGNYAGKISQVQKEYLRKINIGKKESEETKHKIRLANLGKKIPVETRLKMSLAAKGKKHTEEHTNKVKMAKKGCKCWTNGFIRKYSKDCPAPGFVRVKPD